MKRPLLEYSGSGSPKAPGTMSLDRLATQENLSNEEAVRKSLRIPLGLGKELQLIPSKSRPSPNL